MVRLVFGMWSVIAAQLSGRTDNDLKNYWNTKLKKGMGIDPVTHKPFSHLMAEIAIALPPPHVAHLAEAALGPLKDEMLHLLTKKHIDFGVGHPTPPDTSPERIRIGLTRAAQELEFMAATDFLGNCGGDPPPEFGYGGRFGDEGDAWDGAETDGGGAREEEENRVTEDPKGGKSVLFYPDCVPWDSPADDLMNPVV